jgi:hypothetical protein
MQALHPHISQGAYPVPGNLGCDISPYFIGRQCNVKSPLHHAQMYAEAHIYALGHL